MERCPISIHGTIIRKRVFYNLLIERFIVKQDIQVDSASGVPEIRRSLWNGFAIITK